MGGESDRSKRVLPFLTRAESEAATLPEDTLDAVRHSEAAGICRLVRDIVAKLNSEELRRGEHGHVLQVEREREREKVEGVERGACWGCRSLKRGRCELQIEERALSWATTRDYPRRGRQAHLVS